MWMAIPSEAGCCKRYTVMLKNPDFSADQKFCEALEKVEGAQFFRFIRHGNDRLCRAFQNNAGGIPLRDKTPEQGKFPL